jgi:hypothetical protein
MTDDKPQRDGIQVGGDLGEDPVGEGEVDDIATATAEPDAELEGFERLGQLGGDAPEPETPEEDTTETPAGEAEIPDEIPPSTADEATTPEEGEDKTAEDEGEEIDPVLLRQAQEDLGWDVEDIKEVGIARTRARLAREDQKALDFMRRQAPPAQRPTPTEKPAERPEPKLELGELDEDARKQVEAVKEWYADREQQREAERKEQEEDWIKQQVEAAERAERQEMVVFDRVLNESTELEQYLGKGNSLDMPKGSTTRRYRDDVYDQACAIQGVRQQKGLPPLPTDVLTERARNAVFHDQLREIERQKLKGDITEHGKRKTIPPRGKPSAEHADPDDRIHKRIDIFNRTGRAVENPPGV